MTTACGGYFVKGEINRNEQCPHGGDLRRLRLRWYMSPYEIVMICIAALTLLLKLFEIINRK